MSSDTERLAWFENWLRWRPGTRREIWTGASGFQFLENSTDPADKPAYKLVDAIDAAMKAEAE